ncbi:DUF1564 domain-containing protein [Leptospira sp. WS92.C1]
MGILLSVSEPQISSKIEKLESAVETILIPEDFLNRLTKEDRKKLPKTIHSLLGKYTKYISSIPRLNQKGGKRKYQKDVKKLQRVNIRMKTVDWLLLGTLAEAHGVSRCYLLNFIFYLESAGVGDSIVETLNVGLPTYHEIYCFIWQLEPRQGRITRSLQLRPNPLVVGNL